MASFICLEPWRGVWKAGTVYWNALIWLCQHSGLRELDFLHDNSELSKKTFQRTESGSCPFLKTWDENLTKAVTKLPTFEGDSHLFMGVVIEFMVIVDPYIGCKLSRCNKETRNTVLKSY